MKKCTKTPWILSACFCLLFVILLTLLLTVDIAPIAADGGKVGLSTLNKSVWEAIGVHPTLYTIAKYTGYLALLVAAGFALLGFVQLIQRRSLAKVDREILCLAGLYLVTLACYLAFEVFVVNVRPTAPEASFPSSHTLLAITFFGSALPLCRKYLQKRPICLCAQVALCALLVITTVCRFLSGVHWLTDILGGILLGTALLCLFAGALGKMTARDKQ